MRIYQTPGGTVAGSEKNWEQAMKAEGLDPKTYTGRKIVEVPTKKPELMEWLTFHNINLINPQPVAGASEVVPPAPTSPPMQEGGTPTTVSKDIDEVFAAASVSTQLRLAVMAIDNADAVIKGKPTP